jgi:hypothetical protein
VCEVSSVIVVYLLYSASNLSSRLLILCDGRHRTAIVNSSVAVFEEAVKTHMKLDLGATKPQGDPDLIKKLSQTISAIDNMHKKGKITNSRTNKSCVAIVAGLCSNVSKIASMWVGKCMC